MGELANPFSWSRSRGGMFEECRRKYFYHYYGAWGGWEPAAPPEVRRLYVLKQLTGRQGWAGRVVHEAVEMALRVLHAGRDLPEAWLLDETVRRMRQEWRFSKSGGYREAPKGPVALFEHEYAIEVNAGTWQALREHVLRCLRTFHRLPLLGEIRRTPRERWILIEDIRAFDFEGTPVYAAPDFGYWTTGDRLALVDWKTGSPAPEETAVQLGCYALYARDVLDVPPERVDLLEVHLREGTVTVHPWDAERVDAMRERLRLSIRAMKAWLRDPDANAAALEDFERTEELRICRRCNFRVVCRPELDAELRA
ncbi:MAG: PD-(D/E)XK nuclease family protein, partial [Candidatus Rokubacteria bacterium]|nr:PD-(D/E)XK nuclease family protein [Candidatus Rokubacteria bacterium]